MNFLIFDWRAASRARTRPFQTFFTAPILWRIRTSVGIWTKVQWCCSGDCPSVQGAQPGTYTLLPLYRQKRKKIQQENHRVENTGHAVDNHQPLPAHQQVSSGDELRRSDFTFPEPPRLNAAESFAAVWSSCAPTQGIKAAPQINLASYRFTAARLIKSIAPTLGISPGPSAEVNGNNSRPPTRNASSQMSRGYEAPALT